MRKLGLGLACLIGMALGGCAIGNQHQYNGVQPDLTVVSKHSVALAVVDRRPYVVSGDKDPDFVGLQRGGFGNPFDVTTASRQALADDFAGDIVAALKKRGLPAESVTVKAGTKPAEVMQALIAKGKDRALTIELTQWKSDTYTNTALLYNVQASVFDATGRQSASVAKQGDQDLGGSVMNPPGHAKEAVPPAFKAILESLLNAPEIVAALQ